jgi:hypothetical protein
LNDGEFIGWTSWITARCGPGLRACGRREKSIGRAVGIEGNGPSIRLYANNEPTLKLVKVT